MLQSDKKQSAASTKQRSEGAAAAAAAAGPSLLRSTRSGRKTTSVLEWWRGQRLVSGVQDTLVAVGSESTVRFLHKSDDRSKRWSHVQIEQLQHAHSTTDPLVGDFWKKVAKHVDGKNDSECHDKWFEQYATPKVPKKRQKKVASSNTTAASKSGSKAVAKKDGGGRSTKQKINDKTKSKALASSSISKRKSLSSSRKKLGGSDDIFQATPTSGNGRAMFAIGDSLLSLFDSSGIAEVRSATRMTSSSSCPISSSNKANPKKDAVCTVKASSKEAGCNSFSSVSKQPSDEGRQPREGGKPSPAKKVHRKYVTALVKQLHGGRKKRAQGGRGSYRAAGGNPVLQNAAVFSKKNPNLAAVRENISDEAVGAKGSKLISIRGNLTPKGTLSLNTQVDPAGDSGDDWDQQGDTSSDEDDV
uniref:Myb-like domain-containing protein n=1 Tax=Heterosigma akashiwo TaxID=2829 RepID=A0A7S4DBM9_HETAK